MAEKNICGKIPLELHEKVRQEVERGEFIRKVIEEHFTEKGEENMAVRTIAVQVSEEFFARLKAVIAWDGRKQKQFLTDVIEQAISEVEERMKEAEAARLTTEQEEAEPEALQAEDSEPEEEPEMEDIELEETEPDAREEEEPEEEEPEDSPAGTEEPEEEESEHSEAEIEEPEEEESEESEEEEMEPENGESEEMWQEEETEE